MLAVALRPSPPLHPRGHGVRGCCLLGVRAPQPERAPHCRAPRGVCSTRPCEAGEGFGLTPPHAAGRQNGVIRAPKGETAGGAPQGKGGQGCGGTVPERQGGRVWGGILQAVWQFKGEAEGTVGPALLPSCWEQCSGRRDTPCLGWGVPAEATLCRGEWQSPPPCHPLFLRQQQRCSAKCRCDQPPLQRGCPGFCPAAVPSPLQCQTRQKQPSTAWPHGQTLPLPSGPVSPVPQGSC